MRQCLNAVFNKQQLSKKRTNKLEVFDFSYLDIDPAAVEYVQVACTEFICFVTSEAVESVHQ